MSAFTAIWKHRDLLIRSVRAELQKRNAGTVLGRAWLVVSPLLFLAIYAVLYLYVFRLRPDDMSASVYVLRIFAGLVPLLAVSEGLASGVGSVVANQHLFRNTVFPIALIPVRTAIVASPAFLVGIVALVIGAGALGTLTPAVVVLPLLIVLQTMFLVGVLWVFSLITFVFRDIQNIISHLVMLLMIASPIAYTLDMVPERLHLMVWLNPVAWFILTYQSILVDGVVAVPGPIVPAAIGSIVAFVGGYAFFTRLRVVVTNYG